MTSLSETWNEWSGSLFLQGLDPRTWDLNRLLGAYEASLRQSAKDPADWKKTEREIYQPPREVLRAQQAARRRGTAAPVAGGRGSMSVAAAESFVARLAAADTRYGA